MGVAGRLPCFHSTETQLEKNGDLYLTAPPYCLFSSPADLPDYFLDWFMDPEYFMFQGCQCGQVSWATCGLLLDCSPLPHTMPAFSSACLAAFQEPVSQLQLDLEPLLRD